MKNISANMRHLSTCAFASVFMLCIAPTTNAALVSRLGGQAVYDTALNITWVADSNLLGTMAAGNPNIVNQVIAAVPTVYDTPNMWDTPSNSGYHNLTSSDFNSNPLTGGLDWYGAQAWVGYLNSINYLGANNWRLPTTLLPDPSCGDTGNIPGQTYGCTGSEMGELFYNELGGVAGTSILTTHNANLSLFQRVVDAYYWSGTENPFNPAGASNFLTNGGQGGSDKFISPPGTSEALAWAVLRGDIAAVPLPAAVWLFSSGLGLLGSFKRRHR